METVTEIQQWTEKVEFFKWLKVEELKEDRDEVNIKRFIMWLYHLILFDMVE